MTSLPESAQRVQAALAAAGSAATVVEMPGSTRTAQDAADACGCSVGQIAKSLIFRGAESGKAILAIVAGDRRVHEKRLGRLLGEKLERATPEFVREQTGFAIGGVPPIGHAHPGIVVLDEALFTHDHIWAAAGTPRCVFETTATELERLTGGRVLDPT